MARPHDPPIASPVPPALMRWLATRGLDGRTLAERFGFPDDLAALDELPITLHGLDELLGAVAELAGEPSLALRLPAELDFRRYRVHELAAQASADLRAAMVRTARYASTIHPAFSFSLEEKDGEAIWRHRFIGFPRSLGRASHEYSLGAAVRNLRRAVPDLAFRRVWFAHARPRDLGPLHRFFSTREIEFGCEDNGLAFDAQLLDRALPTHDAKLLATIEPIAEAALRAQPAARDFAETVAARVRAGLPNGTSIDAIADALHMSPRTLQRRLGEHGTQFSEVVDGVRADEARRLLAANEAPLAEIAYQLGYADLAAFSRAFKRWTGSSPGQFRRNR